MWRRLTAALGENYARTWADSVVLAALGGRTVEQAIAAGYPFEQIWRAVWKELELPDRLR